jgi:uncharacterized protein
MISRYLEQQVQADLAKKMVVVAGPRQVGKTTMVKSILPNLEGYLNWDIPSARTRILKRELPLSRIWAFDEIHKWRQWRNFLKGLFDEFGPKQQILVSGSAKLDVYRFGGDSLQGRYHFLRLHPLSVGELSISSKDDLQILMRVGGFPEPYFSQSEEVAQRWNHEYFSRLVSEDLASVERVVEIGQVELLLHRLPDLVGSPLSLNALREDLQVSHQSVQRWIEMLERLYALFRLAPFGSPKIKAVKKEQKHYHYAWNLVTDPGARFENLIACHLLKWLHFEQDVKGRDLELRYFRDITGREVDFIVCERRTPILAVECTTSDTATAPSLRYFKERFPNCRAVQVILEGDREFRDRAGIEIRPALPFLSELV